MTVRHVVLAAAAVAAAGPTYAADPFRFKDGDRVVLIGSTLIEREQKYGHWEHAWRKWNDKVNFIVRNIGWSGDTVWGEARNGFDESPKGFERLVSLATELKPTVLVVCYGHNESFAGETGVAKFRDGLNKLLDALAPTKARLILISPTPFVVCPALPDPTDRNAALALYRDVIRDTATARKSAFVDLFNWFPRTPQPKSDGRVQWTENGINLTAVGYGMASSMLLGPEVGKEIREWAEIAPVFWDNNLRREVIVEKDRLFFHRWRPQNETYLFGFRKHEQGKNAAEVAAFDPLIDAADKKIAEVWNGKRQPK